MSVFKSVSTDYQVGVSLMFQEVFFKQKLCPFAQNHALLLIIKINVISGIVHFREIILWSSRNVSETTPDLGSRPTCDVIQVIIPLYIDAYAYWTEFPLDLIQWIRLMAKQTKRLAIFATIVTPIYILCFPCCM